MRLPRNLPGRDLAKPLGKLGYEIVRPTGSPHALDDAAERPASHDDPLWR